MASPAIGVQRQTSVAPTTRIDHSHPAASKLVAAFVPNPGGGMIDLFGGSDLARVGTPTHSRGVWGAEIYGNASSSGASIEIGSTHRLSLQPPVTSMWVGTRYAGASNDHTATWGASYSNAGGAPYNCYMIESEATVFHIEYNNAGSADTIFPFTATIGAHVMIFTLTAAGTAIWDNGVRQGTGGATASISYSATARFVAHDTAPFGRTANVGTAFGAVWNRELSVGEIAQVSANPLCFLRR